MGPGVPGQDDVLLDKVDLEVEFVDGDLVFEVAVKAVGLFDQDGAARWILFRNAIISPKPARPAALAVSTSTNSWAIVVPVGAGVAA